ncbi:MAG: GNAT family N-acetyltransferase [Candidatus Eiseniibacteriota bacterium]
MPTERPAPRPAAIECSDDPARVDLAQLVELYHLTWWAHDRNLDQVRRALAHSRPVLTAWDGEQMVGFTRVISDLTYRATIWDVIVRPSHQGRGVGRQMMHRVLEHPDLKTVTSFLLLTKDKHSFYEQLGFRTEPSMAMVLRR